MRFCLVSKQVFLNPTFEENKLGMSISMLVLKYVYNHTA